ncbi:Type cbb3 cytochrome oxidase biogenesis protein CcoG [Methylophaga frappieri]|uniref:Type cbb3 cytochrome oxidase biogenesis protein CcoG n=1 Tax=Methylophaga frappieri (strain ATCC BAA-2434 / DSM 25690 / JAM7) TaxID=754477 RepID=I1YLM0_METFJ|nr:cytochrome c oxidase accessory protein CcoG [Methylophaga frappieri]AFJ03813.1 Type cbb3 cytochrome oxidase biogenesis protein CcoG [Methylophaga frappieri]
MSKPIDIPVRVELYDHLNEWEVNTGEQGKVVPRRMKGRYRTLKNYGMCVWLIYFLMPYLRWDNRQAILFDIPDRQFHIFAATIYPQDIWVLSLTLLFFAILLAAATSIAGRVFCGYFCFQTVWTDVFTFIEGKLEGNTPFKRSQFTAMPWTVMKLTRKVVKHGLWIGISLLTGLTFSAWFTDAYQLWGDVLQLQAATPVWVALAIFTFFTYWFAGFMREQVCFWLCPYARLQGVMYDQDTVLPAYDATRGEPRGKFTRQATDNKGACIDCKLCVAVCPTGIDIRKGQQEGCITCGLCIDACDSIMDKINQPRGLIRYASYKELHQGKKTISLFKRPRALVYGFILLLSVSGVIYGFSSFSPTEFTVTQQRKPLYIRMSNGDIQNKYTLKLLNKTDAVLEIQYHVSGLEEATVIGLDKTFKVEPGRVIPITAFVRLPVYMQDESNLHKIEFVATAVNNPEITDTYESVFITPP